MSVQQEYLIFPQSTCTLTSADSTRHHSRQQAIRYPHEELHYWKICGKHMSDFCVPSLNVQKISTSYLNDFEKYVTEIHYDPITPVHNIFNKVEDLLEYGTWQVVPIHVIRQSTRPITF